MTSSIEKEQNCCCLRHPLIRIAGMDDEKTKEGASGSLSLPRRCPVCTSEKQAAHVHPQARHFAHVIQQVNQLHQTPEFQYFRDNWANVSCRNNEQGLSAYSQSDENALRIHNSLDQSQCSMQIDEQCNRLSKITFSLTNFGCDTGDETDDFSNSSRVKSAMTQLDPPIEHLMDKRRDQCESSISYSLVNEMSSDGADQAPLVASNRSIHEHQYRHIDDEGAYDAFSEGPKSCHELVNGKCYGSSAGISEESAENERLRRELKLTRQLLNEKKVDIERLKLMIQAIGDSLCRNADNETSDENEASTRSNGSPRSEHNTINLDYVDSEIYSGVSVDNANSGKGYCQQDEIAPKVSNDLSIGSSGRQGTSSLDYVDTELHGGVTTDNVGSGKDYCQKDEGAPKCLDDLSNVSSTSASTPEVPLLSMPFSTEDNPPVFPPPLSLTTVPRYINIPRRVTATKSVSTLGSSEVFSPFTAASVDAKMSNPRLHPWETTATTRRLDKFRRLTTGRAKAIGQDLTRNGTAKATKMIATVTSYFTQEPGCNRDDGGGTMLSSTRLSIRQAEQPRYTSPTNEVTFTPTLCEQQQEWQSRQRSASDQAFVIDQILSKRVPTGNAVQRISSWKEMTNHVEVEAEKELKVPQKLQTLLTGAAAKVRAFPGIKVAGSMTSPTGVLQEPLTPDPAYNYDYDDDESKSISSMYTS